jgi:hypothetical protein
MTESSRAAAESAAAPARVEPGATAEQLVGASHGELTEAERTKARVIENEHLNKDASEFDRRLCGQHIIVLSCAWKDSRDGELLDSVVRRRAPLVQPPWKVLKGCLLLYQSHLAHQRRLRPKIALLQVAVPSQRCLYLPCSDCPSHPPRILDRDPSPSGPGKGDHGPIIALRLLTPESELSNELQIRGALDGQIPGTGDAAYRVQQMVIITVADRLLDIKYALPADSQCRCTEISSSEPAVASVSYLHADFC